MITFDARVLSFPVVQPAVLRRHPELSMVFQDFQLSSRMPSVKSSRPYISLKPCRHPLNFSMEASSQFLQKVEDTWLARSKTMGGVRIYQAFPPLKSWKGMTWFRYQDLVELDRRGYGHLLESNYAHPEDVKRWMRYDEMGLQVQDGVLVERNPKTVHRHNGKPTLSLRKAMERMPVSGSVRGTTAGFPFSCVDRGYLEYLVFDGRGVRLGMKTAEESIPGKNPMRDSILVYLRKSAFIDRLLSKVPESGWVREGKPVPEMHWKSDPVVTAPVRKQWERIDMPNSREMEGNPFCTFGYWEKDSFVACGLPYRLPFQSHGVPTWIKRPVPEGEEKSPSYFEGMESWERELAWKSDEDVEPFRPFVAPKTWATRVSWFWNLSRRVTSWRDAWLHHLSTEDRERSEKDRVRYEWDREELLEDLERMRFQSGQILAEEDERFRRNKTIRRVLRELRMADKPHDDQEIRARHMAQVILEWLGWLVRRLNRRQEEAGLMEFNLMQSKKARAARRFRKAMARLTLSRKGERREDLVVETYGHSAASCWTREVA